VATDRINEKNHDELRNFPTSWMGSSSSFKKPAHALLARPLMRKAHAAESSWVAENSNRDHRATRHPCLICPYSPLLGRIDGETKGCQKLALLRAIAFCGRGTCPTPSVVALTWNLPFSRKVFRLFASFSLMPRTSIFVPLQYTLLTLFSFPYLSFRLHK
jgi:hypothetical protein